MTSSVVASTSFLGVTGGPQPGGNIKIVIDLTALSPAVTADTVTYVFLTYDSAKQVALLVGTNYEILSQSQLYIGGVPEGAVLLMRQGVDLDDGELVLTLLGGDEFTPAFKWRGVATVNAGAPEEYTAIDYIDAVPIVAPYPAGSLAVRFFGYITPDQSVDHGENVSHIVSVVQDGTDVVDAVSWAEPGDATEAIGGPWFTAMITSLVPLPPEPPYVRPPPVDADTFWAYRACCECGDVFLINNEKLAEQWDSPDSLAMDQGDTLLLNYTDGEGTRWSLTGIDNWWTTPPVELSDLKRPGNLDGSFPMDGRYGAREFTVTGVFIPGPNVSAAVPRQRLLRSLDAVRGGALFIAKEPVWSKQSLVYLSGQPKINTKSGGTQLTEFEFTLKAVDPIKYHAGIGGLTVVPILNAAEALLGRTYSTATVGNLGDTYTEEAVLRGRRFRFPPSPDSTDPIVPPAPPNPYRRYDPNVSAGNTTMINAGTVKVYPRVYMYGPCSNPTLINKTTNQQMRFVGDIGGGEVLVCDGNWRTVVMRSAPSEPSLSPIGDVEGLNHRWMLDFTSQWIHIVPGANSFRMVASSWESGAKCVVAYRSGWLG